MNDENNNNELFPEDGSFGTVSSSSTVPEPAAGEKNGSNEYAVVTGENPAAAGEIPDIDAEGAGTCGEFLRIQREKLNLSYEDVFEGTKLKPDMIRALEEEDFSRLPEPVYIIAYVKRLCHFYNVNNALAREFLDELRNRIAFDVPEDFSKSVKGSDVSEENMRRIRNLALAAASLMLLLLLLIVFGVTLVVMNLRKTENQLENGKKFNSSTLIELQPKVKLKITEL